MRERSLLRRVRRKLRPTPAARMAELRAAAEVGLHLGCGPHRIEGLINVDAHDPSVRDVAMDALHLDYPDGTVDLIETHHMFEHLGFEDGRAALAEWRRALKPGGHLVMSVPNLTDIARLWGRANEDYRTKAGAKSVASQIFGSQEHPGMFHRAGYSPASLAETVTDAGFDVEVVDGDWPVNRSFSITVIARRP